MRIAAGVLLGLPGLTLALSAGVPDDRIGVHTLLGGVALLVLSVMIVLGARREKQAWVFPFVCSVVAGVCLRDLVDVAHAISVDEALAWGAVVLAIVVAPRAPYLSWAARDRTDPRGDWRMPGWWTLLALVGFVGVSYALWTTEMPALLLPWTALLLFSVRPEWVPAVTEGSDRLFYDGDCGLCHRAVRFVMAEETRGTVRVAPLFGEAFERELTEEQRAELPDSLIVLTDDGRLLTRDEAVLRIAARCGGLWRALGGLARVVPGPLRRRLYDRIAAVRRGLFEAPTGACPILPPDLRARFDP